MPKSHAGEVEKYWELCRMITYVVCDYVTLDIDLTLFHNGLNGVANYPPPLPLFLKHL